MKLVGRTFRAMKPVTVRTVRVRPDVKAMGWKELLEAIGRDDNRVEIVFNHDYLVLDMALGGFPALVPYDLERPVVMEGGHVLRVTVPAGWGVDVNPDASFALQLEYTQEFES